MSKAPDHPPVHKATAFDCPKYAVYARHIWSNAHFVNEQHQTVQLGVIQLAECTHCGAFSIWTEDKLVYPAVKLAPSPNDDLPDDTKVDYEEARAIVSASPRGSAALLRLAIQKLCIHLGEKGKDLNHDIGSLVKKGLPVRVQQALDVVRVIGNNAVHPGTIDLKDDVATSSSLFDLVNVVADVMISQPKHIEELYGNLSQTQLEQIEKRDQEA